MDGSDDDDDVSRLSAHTLAALQEFYAEQQQRDSLISGPSCDKFAFGAVEEDWLSQFWYSDETALCLAKEALEASGKTGRIACVSAPSIYQKLKGLAGEDASVCLLEYDRRFSVYGDDFVFYDYNNPLDLPERLQQHSCDIVLADPPYLSEECLRKTAETIRYLTTGKIILCTGAVMEALVTQILDLKMCKFIPKHTRSLANEFRCYTNYEIGLDSTS